MAVPDHGSIGETGAIQSRETTAAGEPVPTDGRKLRESHATQRRQIGALGQPKGTDHNCVSPA